jgi:hypothetical protein
VALEIEIPAGELAFERRLELDGDFYGLKFWHNGRADRWFMSFLSGEGELIAATLAISADQPINAHLVNVEGMPPGVLTCVDTQGRGEDPKRDDLGTRHKLIYLTVEDLAADAG